MSKQLTIHDLGVTNAEEQLLAVHYALAVMPGDPGPSLPMVVRLGAVMARLKEGGGMVVGEKGRGTETTTSTISTKKVDERKVGLASAPSKLQNQYGLFMLVAETDKGTVYWATKMSREHTKDEVTSLISSLTNVKVEAISEFGFVYESDRELLMVEVVDAFHHARDGGFLFIV